MKKTLVGYTGFVGSNLAASRKYDFVYNSQNIEESFAQTHELVIYAGVRAEKFLANSNPAADNLLIQNAIRNIERMRPKALVLISTIDVYQTPNAVTESDIPSKDGLHPYGLHRLELEDWVRSNVSEHHIVRLPGLFGRNLKKNFIYDMIHLVPYMMKAELWESLAIESPLVSQSYVEAPNGFRKLAALSPASFMKLREYFSKAKFNALRFTDSRSRYQFYDLAALDGHIQLVLSKGFRLVNLCTEPVEVGELHEHVFGSRFVNIGPASPVSYDMRTEYVDALGGTGAYLASKATIMNAIRRHVLCSIEELKGGI